MVPGPDGCLVSAPPPTLSSATTSRYLGLLEASCVIERLQPFLRSRTSRLVKSPKVYLADSGLAAHLTGAQRRGPLDGEPIIGALFETFVAQNLRSIVSVHRPTAEILFWNVQGRHEVDFVITEAEVSIGVEVKAASRFDQHDLRGLRAFLDRTPGARAGILAYSGREAVDLGERLFAIPLAQILM